MSNKLLLYKNMVNLRFRRLYIVYSECMCSLIYNTHYCIIVQDIYRVVIEQQMFFFK